MIARKCDRCGKFFLPYMLDCNSRASEFYQIIEKVESIDCGGRGINTIYVKTAVNRLKNG